MSVSVLENDIARKGKHRQRIAAEYLRPRLKPLGWKYSGDDSFYRVDETPVERTRYEITLWHGFVELYTSHESPDHPRHRGHEYMFLPPWSDIVYHLVEAMHRAWTEVPPDAQETALGRDGRY